MNKKPNIPQHVAIIMDGNGRWAQNQGKERVFGHAKGRERVTDAVNATIRNNVKYLTLFAFSTENWGRPAQEVDTLMDLLCLTIMEETPELIKQGVRVDIIGEKSGLSDKVLQHITKIKEDTAHGEAMTLILAINYSSQWEVTQMVRNIAQMASKGDIKPSDIDYSTIQNNLATSSYPDPDLLIRTSGECRLSNFLLLQLAYSELYFTDTMWPDFGHEEFDMAISEYKKRNRRYGAL